LLVGAKGNKRQSKGTQMTEVVFTNVNLVFSEVIVSAQVAFIDGRTWSVIAPFKRVSGVVSFAPMPSVDCPVVDLSNIAHLDEEICDVLKRYLTRAGVQNVNGLLDDLVALGAAVSYPLAS
jgi:hypothetical protein